MSELIGQVEQPTYDLASLLAGISSAPLKILIYGTGGSGKSTNLVSFLPAYLAGGYKVIFIFTEDNASKGFKDGLSIYWKLIQPYLKPDSIFIADLTEAINKKNKDYVGKFTDTDTSKSLLAHGGVYETCMFFTERPFVKDLVEGDKATPKKFMGKNSLMELTEKDKVLVILDGYTTLDDTATGMGAFLVNEKALPKNKAVTLGAWKGTGTTMMRTVFESLRTDLIVCAHDKVAGFSSSSLASGDEKKELELKEKMQDEQMQEATGFPAIGSTTTISKWLGSFGLTFHAMDTRLAESPKIFRFVYSPQVKAKPNSTESIWYTRLSVAAEESIVKYTKQHDGNKQYPQDWTRACWLHFLKQSNKIGEAQYEELLKLTGQKAI